MSLNYSDFSIKDHEIAEAQALLQQIINEKSITCDMLLKAEPSVRLALLLTLIQSNESSHFAIRKAMAIDLAFSKLTNEYATSSSSLTAQWLPIEPDNGIKYSLFVRLIYNVQHKDELGFSGLISLVNTDSYTRSQVLGWLSRYPADRMLAGNIYQAITMESRSQLNEEDKTVLAGVDKIMALPLEQYDTIQNDRFLEEWQNKMDMGLI